MSRIPGGRKSAPAHDRRVLGRGSGTACPEIDSEGSRSRPFATARGDKATGLDLPTTGSISVRTAGSGHLF